MKSGIHPEYEVAQITCACGRVTETRSTVGEIHVEICSHCHPFFTGRQKLVDTAGRVERFFAKYGSGDAASGGEGTGEDEAPPAEPGASAVETEAPPVEAEPATDEPAAESATAGGAAEPEDEAEAEEKGAAQES